ncbi:MAG TPA: discoidin domain-containing protein, partial [Allocoleopsis sp.]
MSMIIQSGRFGLDNTYIGPAPIGNEVAARAWRLYGLKGQGNNPQYGEIQLKHTVGGTNQASLGTGLGTAFSGSYLPANAFDNNLSTVWAANAFVRQWVGLDFGAGNKMVLREVVMQQSPSFPTERWHSVLVQYSQDLITWHDYCLPVNALDLASTMALTGDQTFT